ncbi:Chromo domain-containing protein [Cephalotus follicularis]|uniref:Chromo domain-containing protein n=1 Tax=Cephalotus follicularis TaxID=3775 RepID=A0A1Q3AZC3_CEPFO|nr:Chromo domain-containing protein [Cephalotus follicularis]
MIVKKSLLVAQSLQKNYADRRRRKLEFEKGDHVFLRILPSKGLSRFGQKGKLAPRYIGPYDILERVGEVAYQIALPPNLSNVHNVFHVSMLRKYVPDPSHMLSYDPGFISDNLSYEEQPMRILDRKEKALRSKTIPMVKVLWQFHEAEDATWEHEAEMMETFPYLFGM